MEAEWRVIQGTPDFFSITKKMHNALQGGEIRLPDTKKKIFEQVIYENAVRNRIDHDFVIIHDPQPLPLITHFKKKSPWVWRCHIDLSQPHVELWRYLRSFIDRYDVAIVSRDEIPTAARPAAVRLSARHQSLQLEESRDERCGNR